MEKANEKKEAAPGENGVENDIESSAQEVPPPEQASFLESLGLLHVSKVSQPQISLGRSRQLVS